jgi:hypothetical protein
VKYGQQLHYRDGTLRVGCWACDYVMAAELGRELTEKAGEEHLHRSPCPHCGERELHAFGEFGCFPSEVGEPLCRRNDRTM